MVHHGLSPTDPVRYYLAYTVERQIDEAQQERENADTDIEVMD